MAAHEKKNTRQSDPCSVMLCETCTRVISRISSPPGSQTGAQPQLFAYAQREDTWTGSHHPEDSAFSIAVAQRCYICYTLHEACPKQARKHATFFRTFYEIEAQENDQYLLRFAIEHRPSPSASNESQVIEPYGTFRIIPRSLIPQGGARLGLTKNTFSGRCETQVRQWLDSCVATHSTCNKDWRTSVEYPSRLLDVSAELVQQVRLVRINTIVDKISRLRYVTMSHCWNHGPAVHLTKLTTANYQKLIDGFEMSVLPKKFQDAIEIARWMGIKYLWIDALCIMQDSPDDWHHQASIMGNIYAGSYCNIAATNADENAGCFRERPVEVVEPYFIKDPKMLSTLETYLIGYDDFWCNSLLDTDLHTRAWVLQERLLAPRTIHFGKEQMFWECRRHKACEAYPNGIPAELSNRRTHAWRLGEQMFDPTKRTTASQSILAKLVSWFRSSHSVSSEQAYKFWSTAVEWYMDCNLSWSSDKLVAIAGIANKVRETTGERYLAGLWDNANLAQSLLWYVPIRDQADGRASVRSPSFGMTGYRAPSWSWASLDAKIIWNWPAESEEVLITIESTDVEVLPGSMSNIISAEMRVKGRLVPVSLSIMHTENDGTPREDGSYTLTPKNTAAIAATRSSTFTATEDSDVEPLVYLDTALSPQMTTEAYLLPVCKRLRDRNGYADAEVTGLILRKAASGRTSYERIGMFGLDRFQIHIVQGQCAGVSISMDGAEQITLI